jgi:hypothetical protein
MVTIGGHVSPTTWLHQILTFPMSIYSVPISVDYTRSLRWKTIRNAGLNYTLVENGT